MPDLAESRYDMSDSEFHSCLCGSEAGGEMRPAAIACVVNAAACRSCMGVHLKSTYIPKPWL
ncbi:hypothetical protein NAF17_15210 [Mucilaginibacter sp. RB4R14]|uniref:hypothetical protein n=1 Tax=Mucilaginibacter aurantiaciroseus TaxID=2949308 RepID=UPI0020904A56|nr:hypothetical protein [Mucilaginibacter aurantiaciroseus]MCO5936890.1 hypothetical protein [Mucilaginibacter aurantiaciroseus]